MVAQTPRSEHGVINGDLLFHAGAPGATHGASALPPWCDVTMAMEIKSLAIQDVLVLTPEKYGDDRGFFSEVFNISGFGDVGIIDRFVQDNHVLSTSEGILRGLHFQKPPHAQGKLVRCSRGAVLDVAVDIRHGSPTFGKHVAVEISASNWGQIWIPPGFAHGYVTLEPNCEIIYKVTSYYHPASEVGIAWDDPALAIDWRIDPTKVKLSAKDLQNPTLAQTPRVFDFAGSNGVGH